MATVALGGALAGGGVYLGLVTGAVPIDLGLGRRLLIDHAPQNQPYGRREYGVQDREGHRWWFGTAAV